jgi:hypothetical protein
MADMSSVACGAVTKADYIQNLRKSLGDIAFDFPPSDYNLGVENQVKEYFKEAGFSEVFIRDRQSIIQASAGIAMTTYHSTSFHIQCTIGIYTTYALIIDDCTQEMKPEMKDFCPCFLSGKPQGNKLLQTFAHLLKSMHRIFGQFGGDMIIKDSLQYISSCYLETEADKRLLFSTNAPDFAYYFRLKTGVAEAYAFMMFPEEQFPEDEYLSTYLPTIWYMQGYLNFTNDIMSFYKESLALEDTNFVHNYAKSHGLVPTESLQRICTEASEAVQRLRSLSKAHPKVSLAIESFVRGYIVFHLSQPRYRLAELELPVVIEAQRQLNIFGGTK